VDSLSWPPLPAWLQELQASLGDTIRHPLDRRQGRHHARTERYDATLVRTTKPARALASAERLAVYNRQYWLRLFTVLHRAYPLVARLLGYWELNRLASAYLTAHPPRGWDIDAIAPDFELFLGNEASGSVFSVSEPPLQLPALAVRQAAAIDSAHHRVLRAPLEAPYQPTPKDGAALLGSQLRFVGTAALLTESWPLCELRRVALSLTGERLLDWGEELPEPRSWLLMRRELSVALFPLEPRETELLSLLQVYPVGEALGRLEADCPSNEREALPARTQAWLARSVRLGLWAKPERA
jgi:Putative DNA-binding domain